MEKIHPDEKESSIKKDAKVDIINSVQTPLGFFVLVVLIVEVILGVTANTSAGVDKTYLILGMLGLIFLLVLIVSGMAIFRPTSLYGKGSKRQSTTNNDLIIRNIQIQTPKEHQASLISMLRNAEHSVYETFLNQSRSQSSDKLGSVDFLSISQTDYNRLLFGRLKKEEIRYISVQVISSKQRLEKVLFWILLHKGLPYFVRHYDIFSKKFPLFDLLSFDNKHFYLGGFYSVDDSAQAKVLYVHDLDINSMLKDYWGTLWQEAIPLVDDRKNIQIDELERIGYELGMSIGEFEDLVAKLEQTATQVKKQFKPIKR